MEINLVPLRFLKRSVGSFGPFFSVKRERVFFAAAIAGFLCAVNLSVAEPSAGASPARPSGSDNRPSGSDNRPSGSDLVDSLTAPELKQAIENLKTHYFRPAELAEGELQRAMLAGILSRISPGASILMNEGMVAEAASPFKKEILKDSIAYLRMGALTKANLAELDAALKSLEDGSVIFDLRSTPESNDFQMAAEVLQRFCPGGKPLFTIKKASSAAIGQPGQERDLASSQGPLFKGPLMVLVSKENAGASEAVAAVLRLNAKAILIGERTKGVGVEFADFKLGSNKTMRIAISEVAMPDGSAIYPEGVAPDLSVEVPSDLQGKILAKELEQGVAQLVIETERPRMNEASLVAGTNPEMDAYQSALKAQEAKTAPKEPPLRDTVLQRAIDLITTIRIYGENRK